MAYCFGDFEFTCGGKASSEGSEILSAGLVICSDDFRILEKYYSTAKPVGLPLLHKRCVEITHLDQSEIDSSRNSSIVCSEIIAILEKYGAQQIFVWGTFDKAGILQDYAWHSKKDQPGSSIKKLSTYICNIQPEIMRKHKMRQQISISNMLSAFAIEPEGQLHNAYNDAYALYRICRATYCEDYSSLESYKAFVSSAHEKERRIKETEKQRREAVLTSLDESQLEYFKNIGEKYGIKAEKTFLKFYRRTQKALDLYDSELFALYYFNNSPGIRVFPVSAKEAQQLDVPAGVSAEIFRREDAASVVINSMDKYLKFVEESKNRPQKKVKPKKRKSGSKGKCDYGILPGIDRFNKEYFENIKKQYGEDAAADCRRVLNIMQKTVLSSDEKEFVVFYFREINGIKVFAKPSPELDEFDERNAVSSKEFRRDDFGAAAEENIKRITDAYKTKKIRVVRTKKNVKKKIFS